MRANPFGQLAILLAAALPSLVLAQAQPVGPQGLQPLDDARQNRPIGQQAPVGVPGPMGLQSGRLAEVNPDVLTFQVGGEVRYHDNIFNLRKGVKPDEATYGGSGRSDTQLRALLGARLDRQVSLQRFQVYGQLEPVKFMEYSRFDHVAYDVGANWDWAIGRPWFGTLGLQLREGLSSFESVASGDKNKEQRNRYYATGGFRLTPDWAIVGGADLETLRTSLSALRFYDYDFTSYELGARYTRSAQAMFEFVWRHTDGDYPNRQPLDAAGNILGTPVNNKFKQDAALLRVQYQPSLDSRIAGHIGYTSRKYDELSARDFDGGVMGIDFDWSPTGAFHMRTSLNRALSSEELLVANNVVEDSITLRPTFQLTGRTALEGWAQYIRRKYEGDAYSGASVRKEDVTVVGANLAYAWSRTITARAGLQYVKRDSNLAWARFDDTRVSVSAIANF